MLRLGGEVEICSRLITFKTSPSKIIIEKLASRVLKTAMSHLVLPTIKLNPKYQSMLQQFLLCGLNKLQPF